MAPGKSFLFSLISISISMLNILAQILTSATVIIMQITDLKPICPCQKSSKRVDISSAFNSNLSDSYWPRTNPSSQCIWISSERFLESEIELILLPDFNSFAGFLWKPSHIFRMKTHACLWYDQNLLCTTKKWAVCTADESRTSCSYPKKRVLFHMLFSRSHCGHRTLAMTFLEPI